VAADLPTAVLDCGTPEDAEIVAAEASRIGNATHTARQDGTRVILAYFDKRFPLDVASWAFDNGHADDAETANLIARL
jgi:hypothetical protein